MVLTYIVYYSIAGLIFSITENVKIYTYFEAVQVALKIAKQISSVVFFAIVFQFCYMKNIFYVVFKL